MNRKDQDHINDLYTEAVAGATFINTPEFKQIKAEIGNPTGMPLDNFSDLALKALKKAGINTKGITKYSQLFKTFGKALGAEIDYNEGEDGIGYVFADVDFDYNQNQYTEGVQGASGKRYSSFLLALGEYINAGLAERNPRGPVARLVAMVNQNIADNDSGMQGMEPKAFVNLVTKVAKELGAEMPSDLKTLLNDVGDALEVHLVYDGEYDLIYSYRR